jgi:predicted aspartyl protease
MAFEFKITNTLAPGDLANFGPLIKGRVALPTSRSPNDGVGGFFLLDTGSSGTSIDQSVADELGLKPTRTITGHGLGGESEVKVYSVMIFIPAEPLLLKLASGALTSLGMPQDVGSVVNLHQGHEATLGKPPGRLIGLLGRSFLQFTKTTYDGLTGTITVEADETMRNPKLDGPGVPPA